SSILSTVMKKQSAKWPPLAEGYICDIISIVHNFISTAMTISCRDDVLHSNILSFLMDGLIERYQKSLSMTGFLLKIEREGTPMSQNHYLNSYLQKCRQERIASAVKKTSFSVDMHDGSKRDCYQVSDLARIHHMGNFKQTVEDIHDILKSYYKVARKGFVDNVCMQAADFYPVTEPEAPMNIL
ncbi:dynamin, partial [Penicillium waksmanii]|uniref:dynamin n=1 Tax=Penicillium waksmanii TaxID=69791 RepID=UPI0025491898